jgi:protein subunit release factor B
MIEITPWLRIEDDEIVEKATRASGPGGQHVKTCCQETPYGAWRRSRGA